MVVLLQVLSLRAPPSKYEDVPEAWENKLKQLVDTSYFKETLTDSEIDFPLADVENVDMETFNESIADKYYVEYNEMIEEDDSSCEEDDAKIKLFIVTETDSEWEDYISENTDVDSERSWWLKFAVGAYIGILVSTFIGRFYA